MVKDRKQGGAEGLAQAGREKQRTRRAAGKEGAVPASKITEKGN